MLYSYPPFNRYPGAFFLALLAVLLLADGGCRRQEPWRLGFAGCLTGRSADLGIAGRDGAVLAVEQINEEGGVLGRPVDLMVRNDRMDPDTALRVDREMIEAGVFAIVGHMTSSMSQAAVPLANNARIPLISPTTSTNDLTGLDDYFFRVYPPSRDAARRLAEHAARGLGIRAMAAVYDLGNRAHTESWYTHFQRRYEELGGRIVWTRTFRSGASVSFHDMAVEISGTPATGLLVLANAVDTALLCQQLRKVGNPIPVLASEWSGAREILSLGGSSVEGLTFFHSFDPDSPHPSYTAFVRAFRKRFGYDPDFGSVHAYDAARLAIEALRRSGEFSSGISSGIKDAILGIGSFEGVQGNLSIDSYGDVRSDLSLITIRSGRFAAVR